MACLNLDERLKETYDKIKEMGETLPVMDEMNDKKGDADYENLSGERL